jgi:hypothetical protein
MVLCFYMAINSCSYKRLLNLLKIDDSRKTYFHQKTDKPKKTPPPPSPFPRTKQVLQYYLTEVEIYNTISRHMLAKIFSPKDR